MSKRDRENTKVLTRNFPRLALVKIDFDQDNWLIEAAYGSSH